jgi:hypothetical protein
VLGRSRGAADQSGTGRGTGPRVIPVTLSVARIGVGVLFAVRPTTSLRLLGVDSVTASRVDWLARMTAVRDIAIGLGTLSAAARRRDLSGWLLAGAACDALDAAAIGGALGRRNVAVVPAAVEMVVALTASAAGVRSIAAQASARIAVARDSGHDQA